MDNFEPDSPVCDRAQNMEFKLYINNLPSELNQDGIREIFNEYGKIIGFFARPGSGWAYITYARYIEAEQAVRDLHEQAPLYLQVSFAKQKAADSKPKLHMQIKRLSLEPSLNEVLQNEETNSPRVKMESVGRGKAMELFQKNPSSPSYPVHSYTPDDDLLYPVPADSHTYNPYTNAEPFGSSNHLWTKGQLTVTRDGKRHVSLGRGYTLYEIPDPHPNVEEHLNKVYEKRTTGHYEYKEDVLKHNIGRCLSCRKLTKLTCERCRAFYCGSQCQLLDWPRHKSECQAMPALVNAVTTTSLSDSSIEEQILGRKVCDVDKSLRKPKRLIEGAKTQSPMADTKASDRNPPQNGHCNSPSRNIDYDTPSRNAHDKSSPLKSNDKVLPKNFNADSSTKNMNDDDINFVPNKTYRNASHSSAPLRQTPDRNNSNNNSANPTNQTADAKENIGSTSVKDMLRRAHLHGNDKEHDTKNESPFPNDIVSTQNSRASTKVEKPVEDFVFQKDNFLSKTSFTKVQIVLKCPSTTNVEYWVQKVEDMDTLTELMTNLQSAMVKTLKTSPVVGELYAVQYETLWHRVLLTSKNPLIVKFIDYGNEEVNKDNDFRMLGEFGRHPPLARKIRFQECVSENYKNLKPDDTLSVRMVSASSDKVITVEVEEEGQGTKKVLPEETKNKASELIQSKVSSVSPAKPQPDEGKSASSDMQLPCALKTAATIGTKGCLEVHAIMENNSYAITFLAEEHGPMFEKILDDLPQACASKEVPTNYKPAINTLVCGQREGKDWLRGYISKLGPPLHLAAIDEARIMPITNAIPYPKEFMNVPTFGAVVKIKETDATIESQTQWMFSVLDCKKDANGQDILKVSLTRKDVKLTGLVTPWKPAPEQLGVALAELKSGSEVCITSYRSPTLLYVRSLESAAMEHYHHVMQGIAKCVQTAPKVKKPVVGQMVIAPFVDGNHYRAVVTKISDEKAAVSYVDFGNVEHTAISELKVLSDEFKLMPSCSIKIVLSGVPKDVAMTQEASTYLGCLVGREVPLLCTFDGVPSKDGVHLETAKGEKVNEKLVKFLTPSYDREEEEDKTCYMIQHLTMGTLGDTGETTVAIVLYEMTPGSQYVLCPKNPELMTHVLSVMQPLMNKYCESTSYYIPRKEELCLALFEGDWYRAVCFIPKKDSAIVHFVDYGNAELIEHKNIRLMPKDFVTPEALGNFCTIVAPGGKPYSAEEEKIVAKSMTPNECVKLKIVKTIDRGTYEIELPEIHATLSTNS